MNWGRQAGDVSTPMESPGNKKAAGRLSVGCPVPHQVL
jgi:hypothetical protein